MISRTAVPAAMLLAAWLPLAAAASDAAVLGPQSPWRHYIAVKPDSPDAQPLLPDEEWTKPAFADAAWASQAAPIPGRRQMNAVLICLRGRFTAEADGKGDGAKFTLTYRGGAVVYLNGKEIARGDMPAGIVYPHTAATAYPRKVFVTPDGEALLRDYGAKAPPPELADRYEARVRKLSVALPGKLIRKGTNVLAVELHAAPIPADLPPVGRMAWDTVGLESASLMAPAAGGLEGEAPVAAATDAGKGGLVVWSASPLQRYGFEIKAVPPPAKPGAVRAVTARGGFTSLQILVAGAGEKLDVAVEGLPGKTQVRFGRGGDTMGLFDQPDGRSAVQSVWLTLSGAEAGRFAGVARISAATGKAEVPIDLTVLPFEVPPPRRQQMWVNCLQSPESVARTYKVPMWSDRHFELMAPSMALMGLAGNDVLGISAVGRSVFGDDPLILFRKDGGAIVPELKHLRRYLAMYDKHAGPPALLAVHVWNYGMFFKGHGRDGGTARSEAATIPVQMLDGGAEPAGAELPMFGREGTEALWRRVFEELRSVLGELKWADTRLVLGTSGDTWPSEETAAFFGKVAPGVGWRSLTHGCGCPKWGPSVGKRTQPNGMVVDLLELARRVDNGRWSSERYPIACNSRDDVTSNPATFFALPGDVVIGYGYDGWCWKGIDYWSYKTPSGAQRNALNSYLQFGNMVGSTPRAMAVPGPAGAVASQQFEVLREATQQCEAVLAIRRGLHALLDPATRRVDLLELFLQDAAFQTTLDGKPRYADRPGCELEIAIWQDAGQCGALAAAPTLNTATGHTAAAKPLPADRGKAFEAAVTLMADEWVGGGKGTYTIRLEPKGDDFAGTYEGTYEGVARRGSVKGTLLKGGHELIVAPGAPRDEMTRRAEQAVSGYRAAVNASSRRGASYDDVCRAVHALYVSAEEVRKAVEKKNGEAAGVAK